MSKSIFYSMTNIWQKFFTKLTKLPKLIINYRQQFVEHIQLLKAKLHNIVDSNLELGIYHLRQGNSPDAIFRFQLVDKFLEPGNNSALYWLGFSYYLKGNVNRAIDYFAKMNKPYDGPNPDQLPLVPAAELAAFIASIEQIKAVPLNLVTMQRALRPQMYTVQRLNDEVCSLWINKLNITMENLPKQVQILEINSSAGMLAQQIKERMQNTTITLCEIDPQLAELANQTELYHHIVNGSFAELNTPADVLYEIIFSVFGINYAADLTADIKKVSQLLTPKGYFSFIMPEIAKSVSDNINFNCKYAEFSYSVDTIVETLTINGFEIKDSFEFTLKNQPSSTVFICTKLS